MDVFVANAKYRLTNELLGYVLLRLTRHFIKDEYELLADIPEAVAVSFRLNCPYDAVAQNGAFVGAYLNSNTTSAFNRACHTLEALGVISNVAGPISKVVVPSESLQQYLLRQDAFGSDLFEFAIYHFINCHGQAEWGSPSWGPGSGTEVSILPDLKERFEQAGLLDPLGNKGGWSQTMLDCVAPIAPSQSVAEFFEQIYQFEESDD